LVRRIHGPVSLRTAPQSAGPKEEAAVKDQWRPRTYRDFARETALDWQGSRSITQGKGGCKSAANDCKDKNGCKGKGWTAMSDKDCTAEGGTAAAKEQ
jgi:hypothetical protein